MAIQTFDSLYDLSEHFDSPVFEDITDDSLLVHEQMQSIWHRYRWTHGKREIRYQETFSGELPIMVQIYPKL